MNAAYSEPVAGKRVTDRAAVVGTEHHPENCGHVSVQRAAHGLAAV